MQGSSYNPPPDRTAKVELKAKLISSYDQVKTALAVDGGDRLGTVFVVRLSRSGKAAQELPGDRSWGWLITDRWSGHNWYPK
jgi:transposase